MTNFRTDKDADGILTLTWDMPGRTMNVLSQESIAELDKCVVEAIADPTVKGVVLTSGKPAFVAGADLAMMSGITASAAAPGKTKEQSAKEIFDWVMTLNTNFRKMEKAGKPFVAAINGTAMGGGLEVCLACHYRVCADDPSIQLGLPEVEGRAHSRRRRHAAAVAHHGRHGRVAVVAGRPCPQPSSRSQGQDR